MNPLKGLIMAISLITLLNIILNKNSKSLKKEIKLQHYIFGYLFILYLMIALEEVGFPSLFEWRRTLRFSQTVFSPNINSIPFKDGLEISGILNIIFFIPFGFLLPTLWEKYRNLWTTLFHGLFFSIIIETGQLFVKYRATDIDDLILNTLGAICGWLIFNIMKKIFHKLSSKTVVNISSNDTLAIKLEPYLYIVIAIVCAFFK
ncbi:VanZ like family protein [Clostridium acetireducens DSM 10703]|uniref:VanZ like family protein n=1 Tax=Clostridium acetireducens DSM 10703 TaxID=1121290 RepID=A0A1E8EZY5_9CLOT|nr:VanZ family protein [Clostridium acetireducens]OFI06697.1 VanZ like family protein [Clostridium acetireducens DSM 10703]